MVYNIFDNLLVLAHDYQDAQEKHQKVIKKAAEANLVLKMKKSWLGVKQVKFFGYECTKGSFKLGEDRKQAIMDMPMPKTRKQMRRFLGCAVFFS